MLKLKLFKIDPVIFRNREDFYKFVQTTMHQARLELHSKLWERRPKVEDMGDGGYHKALEEIQKIIEEEKIRELSR